jgi:pimeloyl-ACP methyl ester carboxylesterase
VIKPVSFYSEGVKLAADIFYPDSFSPSEKRPAILLCHGYTGTRDLYLPQIARTLNDAGFIVMTFDYKGWGTSEGPKNRLDPHGRVADSHAALTILGAEPGVDPRRLGVYGTSYGGATAVWLAATDPRVRALVSVVAPANGARWMRSVRRPDEFQDLLERSAADRWRRATTGVTEFVPRGEVLLADRASLALAAAERAKHPAAVNTLPLEYVDDTLSFNAEWIVDRISPRAALFIATDDDRLVPCEESVALHACAREPKKLVILQGFGHYDVYSGEALRQVMAESIPWFHQHLDDFLPRRATTS